MEAHLRYYVRENSIKRGHSCSSSCKTSTEHEEPSKLLSDYTIRYEYTVSTIKNATTHGCCESKHDRANKAYLDAVPSERTKGRHPGVSAPAHPRHARSRRKSARSGGQDRQRYQSDVPASKGGEDVTAFPSIRAHTGVFGTSTRKNPEGS